MLDNRKITIFIEIILSSSKQETEQEYVIFWNYSWPSTFVLRLIEITCLKEDIGWDGVLPSPIPHCNKQHHTANPTQNGVEGSYASTKLRQLKTK